MRTILEEADESPRSRKMWPMPKPKEKVQPTDQQAAAIELAKSLDIGESMAVEANAGCGKTALVKMLIEALHKQGLITVTSFSDKSVGELRSRIPREIAPDVNICTFHSLCLSLLTASDYTLSLECTKEEQDNPANKYKKTKRLGAFAISKIAKSETINSRYLKEIGLTAFELSKYAEGAVHRNGYAKRGGVKPISILNAETTIERKIGITADPQNLRKYLSLVKSDVLDALEALVTDKIANDEAIDHGLTEDTYKDIRSELKKREINFRSGGDIRTVAEQLVEYLAMLSDEHRFDFGEFCEFYDRYMERIGYYEVLKDVGYDEDELFVCQGSVLADEDVCAIFADSDITEKLNISVASAKIYQTVALLSTFYIEKGLEIARKERVITFYEMLLLCKLWPIEDYIPRYIIVDESQDFSPLIHSLLNKFVSEFTSLIVVGDSNQSIFEWAGAEKSSYQKLIDQFDCQRLPLSKSFRCAHNIIEYAKKYVPEIECGNERVGDVIVTDKPFVEAEYELGDLVVGRTRLDVANAYFDYVAGGGELNCYAKGVNLLGAVAEVGRKALDDGKKIDRIGHYAQQQIVEISKLRSQGLGSGQSEAFEQYMLVKLAVSNLPEDAEFKSLSKLKVLIEKYYPTYKRLPSDNECVRFLTVHQAKGSEADRVFCLDAPRFYPPSCDTEEKRLTYVMVTRARNTLVLCGGHPRGESFNSSRSQL